MSAQGWIASACGAVGVYLLSVPPLMVFNVHHPHPNLAKHATTYGGPYFWLMLNGQMLQKPVSSYYTWWSPEKVFSESLIHVAE